MEDKKVDITGYDECYIVGGGPSLTAFDWKNLDGKFVIAINRAYEKLPNANIVYFTDKDWYLAHKTEVMNHTGVKYRGRLAKIPEIKDPDVFEIQLIGEKGLTLEWGQLFHGINSTYAAMQVAAQLGFKKIYLLGIDMKFRGPRTHWHSGHKRIDPPQIFQRMAKNHLEVAPLLKAEGIEVINVNIPSGTDLKAYPVQTFRQVFGGPQVVAANSDPIFSKETVKPGQGAPVALGQDVHVHYTGWLYDANAPKCRGKQFDTSKERGLFKFTIGAGQVIRGWDIGVQGMRPGEVRELIIPAALGYGVRGNNNIPPNSSLIFEVEMAQPPNTLIFETEQPILP